MSAPWLSRDAPRTDPGKEQKRRWDVGHGTLFKRQTALVVGALVVGVGRREAFAAGSCSFCGNKRCNHEQKRNCNHSLTWAAQGGGTCVECYMTSSDRANAVASGHGCHYCVNVVCGYYVGTYDGEEEPAVPPVVEAGFGCIDPDTGDVTIWSEPGTPCDHRSPQSETSVPP